MNEVYEERGKFKMLTISEPYLKKGKNKSVRLCSIVNYEGKDEEIWYEVDEKYSEYLCYERADAFLLGFLPYAMAFKHNIKVEGAISERLFYHLKNYYIPAVAKFSNYYKKIDIFYHSLDETDYGGGGSRYRFFRGSRFILYRIKTFGL